MNILKEYDYFMESLWTVIKDILTIVGHINENLRKNFEKRPGIKAAVA